MVSIGNRSKLASSKICQGCGKCIEVCPEKCLSLERGMEVIFAKSWGHMDDAGAILHLDEIG